MSKAIDELKDEHETILSSLRLLDKFSAGVNEGFAPRRVDLAEFVGFLRDFADRCHHGKEEKILFPALYEVGLPEQGNLIEKMLWEHRLGRDYVREMDHAISSGPDYLTFAYAAQGYASLLRNHIQKENAILFPMAETILDPARVEGMCHSFEKYRQGVFRDDRQAQLHGILRELHLKYVK